MDNTLRQALWGFLRPLVQLLIRLLSPQKGEEWEREFKRFLRKDPCWPAAQRLTLHLYAKESGLTNCYHTLEDIWSWIAHPETYPEELKWRTVFLWQSTEPFPSARLTVCLVWVDGRVVVDRRWLDR